MSQIPASSLEGLSALITELELKSAALREENEELRREKALSTGASGLSAAYNDAAQQQKLSAAALNHAQQHEAAAASLVESAKVRAIRAKQAEAQSHAWCIAVLDATVNHAAGTSAAVLDDALDRLFAVSASTRTSVAADSDVHEAKEESDATDVPPEQDGDKASCILASTESPPVSPPLAVDASTHTDDTVADVTLAAVARLHEATQSVEHMCASTATQVSPRQSATEDIPVTVAPVASATASPGGGPRRDPSAEQPSPQTSVDVRTVHDDSLAHSTEGDEEEEEGDSAARRLKRRASAPYGVSRSPSPSRLYLRLPGAEPSRDRSQPQQQQDAASADPGTAAPVESAGDDKENLTSPLTGSMASVPTQAPPTNSSFGLRGSFGAGPPRTHEQLEEALAASEKARAAASATVAQLRTKLDESSKACVVLESQVAEARKVATTAEDRAHTTHDQLQARKAEVKRLERANAKLLKEQQERKASAAANGEDSDDGDGSAAKASPPRPRVPASERSRPWQSPPAALLRRSKARGTQTDGGVEAEALADGTGGTSPVASPQRPSRHLDPDARSVLQGLLEELNEADHTVDRLLQREADEQRDRSAEPAAATAAVAAGGATDAGALRLDWPAWMSATGDAFVDATAAKQCVVSEAMAAAQRKHVAGVALQLSQVRDVLQAEARALAERSAKKKKEQKRRSTADGSPASSP